jgi:hypothetical protein
MGQIFFPSPKGFFLFRQKHSFEKIDGTPQTQRGFKYHRQRDIGLTYFPQTKLKKEEKNEKGNFYITG